MQNKSLIITVVACLVVGAAAFFGGMQYQKSQVSQGANSRLAGRFGGNGQGQNANFRPVVGQIISSDPNSITVKLQDGSSKIVVLSGSTNIMEATSTSKEALKTGQNVMVNGQTNSDGSITAQNIQLNPQLRLGGRGGAQGRQSQ